MVVSRRALGLTIFLGIGLAGCSEQGTGVFNYQQVTITPSGSFPCQRPSKAAQVLE